MRTSARGTALTCALVGALLLCLAAGGCASSGAGSPTRAAAPSSDSSGLDLIPATVIRVVDGDTAVMQLRGQTRTQRVRFIGVDSPESTKQHEPYGEAASQFTKTRLDGRHVWLQIGVDPRDRYGRLLAYVWLERPKNTSESELRAKQFNAQLLLEGYAQVLTVPPNVEYAEQFRAFQAEAREANRGLWRLPAPAQH